MTDWQAWEREAATRAVEALEAGSVAVHDALHSLLECCLQLHPAAAQHLYEAAKKVLSGLSGHSSDVQHRMWTRTSTISIMLVMTPCQSRKPQQWPEQNTASRPWRRTTTCSRPSTAAALEAGKALAPARSMALFPCRVGRTRLRCLARSPTSR